MPVLYIASDQQSSGRTALVAGISKSFQDQGYGVHISKPLYLPVEPSSTGDPDFQDYQSIGLPLSSTPIVTSSEGLRSGLPADLTASIKLSMRNKEAEHQITVVEGLAGLDNKSSLSLASQELAQSFDAQVIAVLAFTPNITIDPLIQAKELFGDRLLGIVINGVTRYQQQLIQRKIKPLAEAAGIRILATLPEDRRLLAIRVSDIAKGLQGTISGEPETGERLVEHLMVGANVLDDSIFYFQQYENKAVLVRGDRPDIHMGVLATPTACLILTGGKSPVEYVQYQAEQESVPIIQIHQPTLQATRLLDGLFAKARFNHRLKLERFQEILHQRLDWNQLHDALHL